MKYSAIVTGACLALAMSGCGPGAPSSEWDAGGTAALKAQAESLFKAIDTSEFDKIVAAMDADAIVFDIDLNNAPVAFHGIGEIKKYFDGIAKDLKDQGLTIKSDVKRMDCQATAVMGFCAVDFDQMVSKAGQSMGKAEFRSTMVGRKLGPDWKWVHWHGSLRSLPPPAAPAPTPGSVSSPSPTP